MPTTTNAELPYPAGTDAPDVPQVMQDLADAIDPRLPDFIRLPSTYNHPASNTTLADVTGMAKYLTVGTWSVDVHLALTTTTPAAADAKTGFTFSGSVVAANQFIQGNATTTTDVGDSGHIRSTVHNLTTAVSHGADGSTAAYVHIHLFLIVDAPGTLQLQFAQNTSNGTQSGLSTASHMIAQQIGAL